eukprot:2739614-Rhodomonas_salina.1
MLLIGCEVRQHKPKNVLMGMDTILSAWLDGMLRLDDRFFPGRQMHLVIQQESRRIHGRLKEDMG